MCAFVYYCLCTRSYISFLHMSISKCVCTKYAYCVCSASVYTARVCVCVCLSGYVFICVNVCVCVSLYIAVVIGAIGLSHVHAAHGQTHAVDHVSPGGHALVDAVQPLGLLETTDPVLRGEASDCWGKNTRR